MRRMLVVLSVLVLAAAWPASTRAMPAGGFEFECYESVAAPGETVRAAVSLTNETDHPVRYRVKARCRGDEEILRGREARVRGRWTRMRITLQPGESRVEEMTLRVPRKASGPMVAELRLHGPDGRREDRDSLFVHDESDGPAGREPVELHGRVVRDGTGQHPLRLVTDGGEEYRLVGSEMEDLYEEMMAQGLEEVDGAVLGYGMAEMPMRMMNHMMFDAEEKFLALDCEFEQMEDLGGDFVSSMPLWSGSDSSVDTRMTRVVQSDSDWREMMELAGIDVSGYGPSSSGMGSSGSMGSMGMFMYPMTNVQSAGGDAGFGGAVHHMGFFHHDAGGVDFETQTLLCIFAGEQDAEGFSVRFRGVTQEEDGSLVCHYSVDEPGRRQMRMGGVSHPYMVVAIPKTDAEVRFTTD